tara:strand:- start:108 stop:458 length:351 start_codon:yes stop_codon:yes gene_type:complete
MARQLTNNYNNSLKISGINATQIPNLALLNIYNQIEISKISDLLNLGPSTVRTNSSIHIKKRFIKIVKKNFKGNVLTLTEKGYNILKKILPIWEKFNIEGKKLLRNYVQVLNKISE